MFRASSAQSSGGYSCTHATYGTVTLYENSWWPVGTELQLRHCMFVGGPKCSLQNYIYKGKTHQSGTSLGFTVQFRHHMAKSSDIYLALQVCFRTYFIIKGKGKAVPLQAWSGPEGSRKLRFPDFMTTAKDGGKVVSLRHRPPLPPGNTPGTHFC